MSAGEFFLTNGHVIDAQAGIDGPAVVHVRDGVIAATGDVAVPRGAQVVDCAGAYVSRGWIDVHVHAYGTLGFADPDSIGIYQGVTSFVDAGGPGVGTLDEFQATVGGRTTTTLYTGAYIRPFGIIGLTFIEDDVRNFIDVPIEQWIDTVAEHRDLIRYLKMGAFTKFGAGPLKLGKGLAEILDLPLYVHIGEFAATTGTTGSHHIFDVAESGDIITHLYHGNLGKVLDDDGRVLPVVRAAERRGVLFDIGFGGFNFSWDTAEKAFAQDLVPHMISSDLQQFNVVGPVLSLSNVLNAFLALGMRLPEIVERVTLAPARALRLSDRAGSLRPGVPADITVFRVDDGTFEIADATGATRTGERAIVPLMTFKNGVRYDADLLRCQDEANWFMQIAEDAPPEATKRFSQRQRAFAQTLAERLNDLDWHVRAAKEQDIRKATILQRAVHEAADVVALPLREALSALYYSFTENPFSIQSGLFLLRLERGFAIERLNDVARAVAPV